jgi:predicted nucleic acid-binding protein
MFQKVLLDTGPLVALIDGHDAFHDECTELSHSIIAPSLTTWPVLTEAAWLLQAYPEGIQQMFVWVMAGKIEVVTLGAEAAPWIATFFRKYRNIEPQLADASLVYLAERENLETIFTLDRHDFSIYRYGRNRRLHLLPG